MRTAPPADLKQILRPLDRDLQLVTERVLECLQHSVAQRAVYLITAGGKRLRPALVLLAGRSGGYRSRHRALIDLAAATELIHTATLIHDDIIDQSVLRRQQPTFHQRFGTERAVLMGDYLYATAFSLLAGLHDPYVTTYMAGVCQQMSRGEFLEVDSRHHVELTEANYLEIIRDKTASLIAACCHLGAFVTGTRPPTVNRVSEFGWKFGMAFQIMDDCLDLIGDERTVGKTVRSDLDKGSLSLPVIYLAQTLSTRERKALFAPLRTQTPNRAVLARIAQVARESGAITQALRRAEGFVQEASEVISVRDGVVMAETYRQLVRYATERVR